MPVDPATRAIKSANASSKFWTPERVKILEDNAATESASGIARLIDGCTRNMVIGKAHRLNVKLKGWQAARQRMLAKTAEARAARATVTRKRAKRGVERIDKRLALLQEQIAHMRSKRRVLSRVARETSVPA